MYDNNSIISAFANILFQMVNCKFRNICIEQCKSTIKQSMLPFPDFIGRNYRGLVVIGANPGPGGNYSQEEQEINSLLREFSRNNSIDNYHKILDYRNSCSLYWDDRNLCSKKMRNFLNFDLEDIAYLNIVKCKTEGKGSSVIYKIGKAVSERCFEHYLKKQLEILNPKYIIAQWKAIPDDLKELKFYFPESNIPFLDGNQTLRYKPELSTKDIKPVFELFARTQ